MASRFLSSDSDIDLLVQLSDWDSDDEQLLEASSQKIRRVDCMQSLDDADFTFRFRLSKPAFSTLLAEIMPFVRVTSTRNHGVSPMHQLLLTLRYFALGTMLSSVADFVGVSKSTAGRIVRDISSALARLYDKYILMHQEAAVKFYKIAGFPRVLGAIDCMHIPILSPSQEFGEEFKNRKGYYSLNIQAVCDADLRLMNVVARWPGSTHNATVFNNSVLRAECDTGQYGNRWLLGDSVYPNRSYLLTPLLNPETAEELKYNEAHVKTRNAIERTFRVWMRRFPVLTQTLRLSLSTVQAIIIATAVLHNICRDHKLEDISTEVELPQSQRITELGPLEIDNAEDFSERASLIHNFFSS